ncbi:MAG: hypothetical protein HY787_01340 [Deltaproteobacteria bacterium]|nr:hypothetical protein [Deltaproteobacteria bacterium]
METTAGKTEGMNSMPTSDIVYEAIKGAGMIGGYLQNIFSDAVHYAGKTVGYVRSACFGFKDSLFKERDQEGRITIIRLMRSEAEIDEADRREFYMDLGRDMVEATKSGLEGENLTIIDLSRYKL